MWKGCGQVDHSISCKPEHEEAYAAFCQYAEAKQRVDKTMAFADAQAAGRAWVAFLNAYLDPGMQLPLPTAKIINFPRGQRS